MLPKRRTILPFLLAFICMAGLEHFCAAQQITSQPESNFNLKTSTFGGTQFWTDIRVAGKWRIQKNSYFGHCRLLDDQNVRHAWGKQEACDEVLNRQIRNGAVTPNSGKVVVLLHGLCRSWRSMKPMAEYLEANGYQVINFRYASSRKTVDHHASALANVISSLPKNVSEINFVAHSLGNIVVRHYVNDCETSRQKNIDPRINRMVMIGPPNQGSRMARLLKSSMTFKLVAGASGAQLGGGWETLEQNLSTPSFEFGIIAGNFGEDEDSWSNVLLTGPDDFTVSRDETLLPGANDFLTRPLMHTTMMHDDEVMGATDRFLKLGHFVSKDKMNPIESLPAERPRK